MRALKAALRRLFRTRIGYARGGYTAGGEVVPHDNGGRLPTSGMTFAGIVHHAEHWATLRQYEALKHTGMFDGMTVHIITEADLYAEDD